MNNTEQNQQWVFNQLKAWKNKAEKYETLLKILLLHIQLYEKNKD
jgi:hypothetical protein